MAVTGMEREVHRLKIHLRGRLSGLDGLDVTVTVRELLRVIPKLLVRLPGWMEALFPGERVDFREKSKRPVWDIFS